MGIARHCKYSSRLWGVCQLVTLKVLHLWIRSIPHSSLRGTDLMVSHDRWTLDTSLPQGCQVK